MANTYIGIANLGGETFSNALQDDLILYASEPARVLLGTQSNVKSKILIGSSNTIITDNTVFDGDITVQGDALMVNDLVVQGIRFLSDNRFSRGLSRREERCYE